MSGITQEARILLLLEAAFPNWVPAPELANISLQYCSRIFTLRRQGWQISSKIETRDGVKCGYFRLGPVPLPSNRERRQQKAAIDPKSETKTNAKPNLVDHPDALFGDFSPSRYPD